MGILQIILAPNWLVSRINFISLLFAGALLVYFGKYVHGRLILPMADWFRYTTKRKTSEIEEISIFSSFIAATIATIFFLLYVYFGTSIVANYLIAPIMYKLREFTLIVVILLFTLLAYAINNIELRTKIMGS